MIPDVGGMVENAAKGLVCGGQANPAGAATKNLWADCSERRYHKLLLTTFETCGTSAE